MGQQGVPTAIALYSYAPENALDQRLLRVQKGGHFFVSGGGDGIPMCLRSLDARSMQT